MNGFYIRESKKWEVRTPSKRSIYSLNPRSSGDKRYSNTLGGLAPEPWASQEVGDTCHPAIRKEVLCSKLRPGGEKCPVSHSTVSHL